MFGQCSLICFWFIHFRTQNCDPLQEALERLDDFGVLLMQDWLHLSAPLVRKPLTVEYG